MSDYMTVDEFCLERGLDLTPEQRGELAAACEAYCRNQGIPFKQRLLAPNSTVIGEHWVRVQD